LTLSLPCLLEEAKSMPALMIEMSVPAKMNS